jgi:CheY-like chemotaxis protein
MIAYPLWASATANWRQEKANCCKGGTMVARILLIDDQTSFLRTTSHILKQLGRKVEIAHDGEKGVELFETGYDFDLVITDIEMPGMDGSEVARHVRASDKPDTPIVAMTGSIDDRIHRELFNIILPKPYTLDSLVQAVRLLI